MLHESLCTNSSKTRCDTFGFALQILVWKELNYGSMREKEKQLVVSEVNILRELRHPFIVRYYDRIIDKAATKIYIVMEYCEGGDLGGLIKRCKKEGFVMALLSSAYLRLTATAPGSDTSRHRTRAAAHAFLPLPSHPPLRMCAPVQNFDR